MNGFPLGRAPSIILMMFVIAAPFVLARPKPFTGQLEYWTFAQTHYDEYVNRVKDFEKRHPGVRVKVSKVQEAILRDKLAAAFLSDTNAPDLVEVEISNVSRFFQGRASDIGFVDLTDRLKAEGWFDKLVPSRLVPWTVKGRTYGVPHDVHPVILLYRRDLLDPLGIDLPKEATTWDEFYDVLQRPGVLDSRKNGKRDRHGIMHVGHEQGHFRMLLLQRGQDLFNEKGEVIFDSPLAIDTLRKFSARFYVDHLVFRQPINWGPDLFGPMKEDRLICAVAPDWFYGSIKTNAPEVAGKWRAMALPVWEPGGRRTSTMGGTMVSMTKKARNPELAWELLKYLNFERDALVERYRQTRIIPPLKAAWADPFFAEPDDYCGGQPVGTLLADLADEVPPVQQGKYLAEAITFLNPAVYRSTTDKADPAVELKRAADWVRNRQQKDRFVD
jgi:arabinosaccharide transport system substrate-binding protein